MPPKKVIKAEPKKAGAKVQQAAEPAKKKLPPKRTAKNAELEEPEPSEAEEALRSPPRKSPPRRNLEKSPAPSAPSPGSAASHGSTNEGILAKRRTNSLHVQFDPPRANSLAALEQGLVLLRRNSKLCDVTIISGSGRIPAHRVVLAAHSEKLAARFQDQASELDLQPASHEAADLVVRWLYGEVEPANFNPTTAKVNEEVLRISSELGLPGLAELCAMRLAELVDTASAVSAVRLCEEYGLPTLRAAIVDAIVNDPQAMKEVSMDANTLTHPVLMRELLAAIATHAATG
eukprot:TRINITY_DN64126_c0_g1_i1.p1 TRINITY_DN64126_c0_g1~~TRINITY_DN64126_c0_g1_i1.p1  ORF type:complete len:290 (-),score=61.31 TRINITY_DN64126_c0_g1_i1:126-995(-)